MHTCARCALKFDMYFLYKMHLESHKVAVKDYGIRKSYTPAEKRAIVERCEMRLGRQHFIGG
jgi:hypothetical protein